MLETQDTNTKEAFLVPFSWGLLSAGECGQVNNHRDLATWEQPEYPEKTPNLDPGRKTQSGGVENSAGPCLQQPVSFYDASLLQLFHICFVPQAFPSSSGLSLI